MDSLSIVIPAYNEAPALGRVLSALRDLEAEVIVVDDGADDGTARVAEEHGARVERHERNQGKAAAMESGVRAAKGEILVFLDADLVGLTAEHVEQLWRPVAKGEADLVIGVFRGGRPQTDWAHRLSPNLSGQRALRAALAREFPFRKYAGYAVDRAMVRWARARGLRIRYVPLRGVTQVMKEEKRGFWRGVRLRIRMYREILGI